MSTFGEDLIQSLSEVLAHAKGEGPANVHAPIAPREVRKQAKLTQAHHGSQEPNATTDVDMADHGQKSKSAMAEMVRTSRSVG